LNERIAGFLIDECLSGELADLAIEHDYYALATTQMGRWRGRNDYNVARFAIDRDLVLVTNDQHDFEAIYERIEIHPGIVFITAGRPKLRELKYQLAMFALVLEQVEEGDPMSEAILVTAKEGRGRQVRLTISRYAFP
jgi:predicted nuclease of predicted toxin-antitoxin system